MLADAVVKEIEQNGAGLFDGPVSVSKSDFTPRSSDIIKIDVSDIYEVQKWVDSVRPDYIFHLAAETDVDLCERAPDNCYKTNMIGTENVALISRRNDIPLLYISTAAIFSGNKSEPYIEFDNPGPVNTYGKSKLFGEFAVQGLLKKYFIVRAGWMVGGWNIDKKFVYKIVMQLLSGAREINVVNDKFGSLTFTNDFAKNLLILLKTERYGIYHMANVGVASRFEIAKKIVE
jgi:dTDP-4-dehydrorhamnose reductase